MDVTLVPTQPAHFDWLIGGALSAGPDGLWLAEPDILPADILTVLKEIAEEVQAALGTGMWLMVRGNEVVGMCGIKDVPDAEGLVEIGYNVVARHRNQGVATNAVSLMADTLGALSQIRGLTAETTVENAASISVLEHNGFRRIGEREDELDGDLFVWRRMLARRKSQGVSD